MAFTNLLDIIYPINSLYMSFDSTSPAQSIGGSWNQIIGKVIRGNDDIDAGGNDTHTLTESQIPSHAHSYYPRVDWIDSTNASGVALAVNGTLIGIGTADSQARARVDSGERRNTGNTGNSSAHNNLPAYQNMYIWRRTA